jgi:hypothetical protein
MRSEAQRAIQRRQYANLKRRVLEHYSLLSDGIQRPRCADCGEETLDYLHLYPKINPIDRRELGYGKDFLEGLEVRGYPGGFEVLCLKCRKERRNTYQIAINPEYAHHYQTSNPIS